MSRALGGSDIFGLLRYVVSRSYWMRGLLTPSAPANSPQGFQCRRGLESARQNWKSWRLVLESCRCIAVFGLPPSQADPIRELKQVACCDCAQDAVMADGRKPHRSNATTLRTVRISPELTRP